MNDLIVFVLFVSFAVLLFMMVAAIRGKSWLIAIGSSVLAVASVYTCGFFMQPDPEDWGRNGARMQDWSASQAIGYCKLPFGENEEKFAICARAYLKAKVDDNLFYCLSDAKGEAVFSCGLEQRLDAARIESLTAGEIEKEFLDGHQ